LAKENKKLDEPRGGSIASGAKQAHPVDRVVGENVRRLRLQCGMSQEQLGAQSGVTFQQIQKYEKGSNRVSASRLDEFAQLFNVDHNAFFTGAAVARNPTPDAAERLTLSTRAYKLARLFDELSDKKKQQAVYSLVAQMAGGSPGSDDQGD
jgi:transcriptional regulator with XRE-family HTH domain